MSETMVERVARRLADAHFRRKQHYGHCTQDDRVAHQVEIYWRNHEADARAAIEAMREPTKEVADACEAFGYEGWGDSRVIGIECWQAGIDAALK